MARKPRGRVVNGILLLDKPSGLTSNQALQRVKRLYNAQKAGHTGSLDPLASGLLPICFGHATKLSRFLLDADKRYEVEACFGRKTDTGDAQGQTVGESDVRPGGAELAEAAAGFRGEIEQIPPMYSALKKNGQRLYTLARKGIEVVRAPRTVTIHELIVKSSDGDSARLSVRCSKGTYIRTLVEDIAIAAGTLGHVAALRRRAAGPFGPDGLHTLAALAALAPAGESALDALLLPMDQAIPDWPAVGLDRDLAYYLRNGQPVTVAGAPRRGQVRLYAESGRFIGIGEIIEDGRVAPRRLFL